MSEIVAKLLPARINAGRRHAMFGTILAASVALVWKPIAALIVLCLHGDSYSHILLIPFITLYLFYAERARIFDQVHSSWILGGSLMIAGTAIFLLANPRFLFVGNINLSALIFGLVIVWIGAFVGLYGTRSARQALFPWFFFLLMIPIPELLLSRIVSVLQYGSVEISFLLFKLFGVPVLRQGIYLSVPGVTIAVAQECSSIRSSMALFITCLLAARFYLRRVRNQVLFVLLSLPLSVVKNGIRITTLTLLSLYVNPGFLHGDLHRDGGFVFFLLALALMWPVLTALRVSENPAPLRSREIQQVG